MIGLARAVTQAKAGVVDSGEFCSSYVFCDEHRNTFELGVAHVHTRVCLRLVWLQRTVLCSLDWCGAGSLADVVRKRNAASDWSCELAIGQRAAQEKRHQARHCRAGRALMQQWCGVDS